MHTEEEQETIQKENRYENFLRIQPVHKTREVELRGVGVTFTLRRISAKESKMIERECTVPKTNPRTRMTTREVNREKWLEKFIVASIVKPDLRDAALQDTYGVVDPYELLLTMLPAGDMELLQFHCLELNGYTDIFAEEVEEAKN